MSKKLFRRCGVTSNHFINRQNCYEKALPHQNNRHKNINKFLKFLFPNQTPAQVRVVQKETLLNMIIKSPLSITLPRVTKADKKIYLNLNAYRNLHFQISNQAKVAYCEIMSKMLGGVKFRTPIVINFTLHRGSRIRKADRSNVLSIIEKFFCDTLVELQVIPDDSDEFIESTHYFTGEVDKYDPRVEIEIIEPKLEC